MFSGTPGVLPKPWLVLRYVKCCKQVLCSICFYLVGFGRLELKISKASVSTLTEPWYHWLVFFFCIMPVFLSNRRGGEISCKCFFFASSRRAFAYPYPAREPRHFVVTWINELYISRPQKKDDHNHPGEEGGLSTRLPHAAILCAEPL